MINIEHGALRSRDETVVALAGFVAHAVLDHRYARAFSLLNAVAVLELEQWYSILQVEKVRRRTKRKDLDREVRRRRALVIENEGTRIHDMLIGFVNEIIWHVKRASEADGNQEQIYRGVIGMLTAATFAILYGERIGGRELTLIHAPFESFIPLAALA